MATNEDYEKIRKRYPAKITRARAIKLYCKSQCCCNDLESWKDCTISSCFLWRFRLGKEILGNQTSFKKTKGKVYNILQRNIIPQEVSP
ncbi:MAG: hypothetical protein EHM25_06840 [Nitrosopumilales archaeon]|nr:MAG: hypothetical protein EHM25_06840 [Nitrosopumilales archaeon]